MIVCAFDTYPGSGGGWVAWAKRFRQHSCRLCWVEEKLYSQGEEECIQEGFPLFLCLDDDDGVGMCRDYPGAIHRDTLYTHRGAITFLLKNRNKIQIEMVLSRANEMKSRVKYRLDAWICGIKNNSGRWQNKEPMYWSL